MRPSKKPGNGLKAEVTSPFELHSAVLAGFKAPDIIVNGPCKSYEFLVDCVKADVRFIVIDSLSEIRDLQNITQQLGKDTHILLRINPDYIPAGMNSGTATGSRKGCAFGLDLKNGEPVKALALIKSSARIHFHGFHMHIGTGIRNPKDYTRAILKLKQFLTDTIKAGFCVKVLDIGGGFASFTTRELTSTEMLVYQGFNRFPGSLGDETSKTFTDFTSEIASTIKRLFHDFLLPELIYEPGRSIASPNQFLLLTVHRVKNRTHAENWLITDGGLGTVTMPTYYEYHEVFLCNDPNRPLYHKATITGPCCFAADIVYKGKLMPEVSPGETLAIMDTGAYFIALESSFGHPRPAVVEINNRRHRLIRERESFDYMLARDISEIDMHIPGNRVGHRGSKDQRIKGSSNKSKIQKVKHRIKDKDER